MILPVAEAKSDSLLSVVKQGGGPSNTPPLNNGRVSGGIDTAHVCLYIDWDSGFLKLLERLELAKAEACELGGSASFCVGSYHVVISERGYSSGGSKGFHAAFSLSVGGVRFGLTAVKRCVDGSPNGFLVLGSDVLTLHGSLREVYDIVVMIIRDMGGKVERHTLSRVDPCVDIPDLEVAELMEPALAGGLVSRARHRAWYQHGLNWSGCVVGRSDVLGRIYDKRLETERDPNKWALLLRMRLPAGTVGATRCEFQVRRGALKRWGIDTIDDWYLMQEAVCKYLCHDWLRIGEPVSDRRQTSRQANIPAWERVQEAFADWTGGGGVAETLQVVDRVVERDTEALETQALGCLLRVVAEHGEGEIHSKDALLVELTRYLDYALEREDRAGRLEEKQEAKLLDFIAENTSGLMDISRLQNRFD